MKRHIKYLALLLVAFFQLAQASQSSTVPTNTNTLQSDCKELSDNRVTNATTALRVTVVSCADGERIIVDRKYNNNSAVTESKVFNIPDAGVNEVFIVNSDAFYINFLQSRSYANPSIIIYNFFLQNNKWRLEDMSFQATQSCNDEAGVDADYYEINYLTGKVDVKEYEDCEHYRTKNLTVKPASIFLEEFNPSDDRLSPFQYN